MWHEDDGWWSEELLKPDGFAITAVFSPDGRFLAGGGDRLTLWELGLHGARPVRRLPVEGIHAVAFSPDSTTLAVTFVRNGNIMLWDLVQGRQRASLPNGINSTLSVAFSPDGRYLAAGGSDCAESITLWNLVTGECTLRIKGRFGPVRSLAFSPDGTSIATCGGHEPCVRLWDARSGRLLRSFAGHAMTTNCLAFSPDGTILATVGNDSMGRLWKVATGELETTLDGQSYALESVAFSTDGRTLAVTGISDNDVRLWELTKEPRNGNRHAVHLSVRGPSRDRHARRNS